MFDKFYNIFTGSKKYYKSAFSIYFYSCVFSIIGCLLLSIITLFNINYVDTIFQYALLSILLVFVSLNLENINFKFIRQNNLIRHLFLCSIVVISGILSYTYIIKLIESSNIAILQYCMLIFSLSALFVSFNLRFNFYSFFYFVSNLCSISFIILLLFILFGITFISIDFLFNISFYDIYRIYSFCLILIFTISFVFFIGKVSLINHYSIDTKEEKNIINNKNLNYLFLIFSIFSYLYIGILFIYFLAFFFGVIDEKYSAIHLIIWFSFFGILLFWLNKSFDIKYFGKLFLLLLFVLNIISFYSIFIRISDYGFTPLRYFVLISCLFLFITIIFSYLFHYYLKILFYLFALLCIISSFGSFSAISISISSQLNELKKLELIDENRTRIANIYYFLSDYLSNGELGAYKEFIDSKQSIIDSVKYVDFDIKKIFNVKDFDVFIQNITFDTKNSIGDYKFILDSNKLIIYENKKVLLSIDDLYSFLIDKVNTSAIDLNYNGNNFRLHINSIKYDITKHSILSLSFDILIKHNNK